MSLTLVTFVVSPYALRISAALKYLEIPFEIKYIDINNKPEWFYQASPLEKVPILLVGDKVLFESLPILEYISTLGKQSILPNDPLEKAINIARGTFSNEVLTAVQGLTKADSQEQLNNALADLRWYFEKLEVWLGESKFIQSDEITFADFAFAPIFILLNSLQQLINIQLLNGFPKLQQYIQTLLGLPSIQQSKADNFEEVVQARFKELNGFILKQ